MRRLPVLASLVLLAAGCVAPADDDGLTPASTDTGLGALVPPVPDFDFSTVVDPDHTSHQIPDLHKGGHGLGLVGHAGIQKILPPTVRGSISQIDVWGDYAVVSGMDGGLAFAIVDVTDPANPQAVSWWPSVANGWTARFSDDGSYVFYGCQILSTTLTRVTGSCEDPSMPRPPNDNPSGVVVVDVKDKANPKFVHFLPVSGSHNIFTTAINGTDYVFTASTAILKFDREAGKLELVAEVPGVHDATVAKHPVTGDWLLYTGTGELAIYNVNDPANPQVVYESPATVSYRGWHEQTLVPGLVDGRVILALAGETGISPVGGVQETITFLDVTDPGKPDVLGTWKPPFEPKVPWFGYLYSAHEMAATPTGQVAIAWYHAGVWVVDVSTRERQETPVTLAAYLPEKGLDAIPGTYVQTAVPVLPNVWGVGWDDRGYLLVPDMHTGLYVMEPAWGLHPAIDGGQ